MNTTEMHGAGSEAAVGKVDMLLEIQVVPVSDVDRSKEFYQRLGWRLDDDAAPLPAFASSSSRPPVLGPRSRSARDSRRPRLARPKAG